MCAYFEDIAAMGGQAGDAALWVVTGAGGFFGSNLVRLLTGQGRRVRATYFEDDPPPALEDLDVEAVRMDVRDPESVRRAFTATHQEPVWVIHCAGIVSIASSVSPVVYETNVTGVRNVIEACRATGVERLVYISSVHALRHSASSSKAAKKYAVKEPTAECDDPDCYDPAVLVGEYSQTKAEATAWSSEQATCGVWRSSQRA